MTGTLPALRRMADQIRVPRLRSMREFAETEIIIPDGPLKGRRYRCDRQPCHGLLFDAIDSGAWRRNAITGVQQSGKTLAAYVIPIMFHLFEVGEGVLCGVPSLDMVHDKWTKDLLPAIAASRYRDLLPVRGEGSKGGRVRAEVAFGNGTTLRFMTGGGDDQSRSAYTTRVLAVTEVDGFDRVSDASREADQLSQLEGRTRAYGDRARIYLECTPSLETGRIWREYHEGTQSRIAIRCTHCQAYVSPEREHLVGWQDAKDVIEAGEKTRLACPACGALWDEQDRRDANADAKLVHRGQTIHPDGTIEGDQGGPRTDTLGFRWNAANNLLVQLPFVGQEEWRAARDPDEDRGEKKMRQWFWALPHKPAAIDLTVLDAQLITRRTTPDPKGRIPTGTRHVTVGIDLGKYLCHWLAIAWKESATPHVFEYGRIEVPTAELGVERALLAALKQFKADVLDKGWESDAGRRGGDITLVDSGDWPEAAYAFCEEAGSQFLPSKGLGIGQDKDRGYREVKQTGAVVVQLGDNYHVAQLPERRTYLVEVNVDFWKSRVHERLQTPTGQPGAMTLHATQGGQPVEHLTLAKHLTAEKRTSEFVPGKGAVTRWVAVHRNNHWFDAAVLAFVAGHGAGERIIQPVQPDPVPAPPPAPPVERPDWLPERPEKWVR